MSASFQESQLLQQQKQQTSSNTPEIKTEDIPQPAGASATRELLENDANANDDVKEVPPSPRSPPTQAQAIFGWTLSDILIYLTILNLFAEYIEKVRIDSFTVSILTAIVLKLVLEGVHQLQHYFHHVFWNREGKHWKLIGGFFIWLVLFGSKFLIFWLDGLLFPKSVDLGNLKLVLVLSVVLMLSEQAMRYLYKRLGKIPPPNKEEEDGDDEEPLSENDTKTLENP